MMQIWRVKNSCDSEHKGGATDNRFLVCPSAKCAQAPKKSRRGLAPGCSAEHLSVRIARGDMGIHPPVLRKECLQN